MAQAAILTLKTFTVLATAWALLVALTWIFQRKLIYFPFTAEVPPAARFLNGGQDVAFQTDDGLRLAGWFLPGEGEASGATVLVFNGNAGDRSLRAPLALALSRAGISVLLFDYRGFGGNPGKPSEAGLAADARAARGYLASRPGVDPARIVYYGESLGSAVAVGLAVEYPPAAIVLRSPFTSLADIGRLHYPFLPVRLLLRDRFPCIDQVRRLSCPLLVVAGEKDRIVPPSQSSKLFDAAAGTKRFVLIPGADHNDEELLAGERLLGELLRFLKETARIDPLAGTSGGGS